MKFFAVIFLALLSFPGFTQGEGSAGTDPVHADEKVIEEMHTAHEKRLNSIQKVQDFTQSIPEPPTFDASSILNMEKLDEMEKLLKEAKMSQVPPEEMRMKILEQFRGHPLENFIRSSPRLQNFMVDFMRDDKALINAVHIFKDRQRLKFYLYIWIGIMFTAYYTKRLFISKFWPKAARNFAALLFSLTISLITMSSFCLVFEAEMKPIIALVKKYL
ncbi:MAG: hypothetical protein ACJ76H_17320 [Bacteriovoracaceae bacterium]